MQHGHVLKKLNFDLLTQTPRVVEGESASKKLNFDLLIPTPGSGGWVLGLVGVCGQNICCHAAAFLSPLICCET